MDGISQHLIDRFRADLGRVWPDGQGQLALAVSGGPDSLALLLLAHAALPGRVAAATVDHQLRAEAAAEAALVAQICGERNIPHQTLTVTVGPGNLQDQARKARYDALFAWVMQAQAQAGQYLRQPVLATAHHADDQAETLLMRLNRGSGLAGLAGVRGVQTICAQADQPIRLIRPLLGWRKGELVEIVKAAGIQAAADPSNQDDRFDRARMRKALAERDWLDPLAAAKSAQHLAEAMEVIDWIASREWASEVTRSGRGFRYTPNAPRLIEIETVSRIFAALGAQASRSEYARLRDRLADGKNASLAGVLASPEQADGAGGRQSWLFRAEPPRRN